MKAHDYLFIILVGAWAVTMVWLVTVGLPSEEPTYHHGYWTPSKDSIEKEVGMVIVEGDTLSVIETTKYFYRFKQ